MKLSPVLPFGLLFVAAGCGSHAAPLHPLESAAVSPPALAEKYDAGATGTIKGTVVWKGELTTARSFHEAKAAIGSAAIHDDARNPHLPRVNPNGKGVGEAVIFLRKVEPSRSKPWDLSAVRAEMNEGHIRIEQGTAGHLTGFVRAGQEIEMVSHSKELEILRARGSAFFTLAFPEPEKPLRRKLRASGLVELTGATTNYWARSWLFVVDHPYYTRTDTEGRFTLDNVPAGHYELVCWMPNWLVGRFERNPENLYVGRLWFLPPMEMTEIVQVRRGEIVEANCKVGETDFKR